MTDLVVIVGQHDRNKSPAGLEPVVDGVGDVFEVLPLGEGRVHDDALELAAVADGGVGGREGEEVGDVDAARRLALGGLGGGIQVRVVLLVEFDHGHAIGAFRNAGFDQRAVAGGGFEDGTAADVGTDRDDVGQAGRRGEELKLLLLVHADAGGEGEAELGARVAAEDVALRAASPFAAAVLDDLHDGLVELGR